MNSRVAVIAVVVALGMLAAPRAARAAADKEHQQIMAELRMLQEHQAQLHQMLIGLTDTLKLITTRLDDQSTVTRKAFADQKLLIDNITDNTRILRERADDTNVRLSNVAQELQSLRQTITSMPPVSAMPVSPGDPASIDPGAQPPPATTTESVLPPNISPAEWFQRVTADYTAAQYDLAIAGFEALIRNFPTSPQADDAQLLIGNSLYNQGAFKPALAAYQKVITDFPQGDQVPTAHFKVGLTYENLQDLDAARKTYEMVVEKFPTSLQAHTLARNRLDALNRKR
jgi:tol-pal system protein YbgF